MKKAMFIVSLFVSVSALAQEVSVKTLNGQRVKVSADEIVRAYNQVSKDPAINTRITNGDGNSSPWRL